MSEFPRIASKTARLKVRNVEFALERFLQSSLPPGTVAEAEALLDLKAAQESLKKALDRIEDLVRHV